MEDTYYRSPWLTGSYRARYREGALVINIGDIFQRWTNDVFVSNQHRVTSPPGRARHSIAAFYHLDHDTPVAPAVGRAVIFTNPVHIVSPLVLYRIATEMYRVVQE